jgi:two-component system KDP operon response regulator KdpE
MLKGIVNVNATLLLIDDDFLAMEALRSALTERGFRVEVAHDAISGLQKAYSLSPDVILLNVTLPDGDGWQLCCRLREMSDVPIVMLTAVQSENKILRGLEMGADAYVVKPVGVDELVARVCALLRRSSRSGGSVWGSLFTFEGLVIDFEKREITVDGNRVELSPTEFRLLAVLARHQGRVLPHDYLLREVWGSEYVGQIDYLRLYISYLRHKLEKNPSKPSLISNEWGIGYRLG